MVFNGVTENLAYLSSEYENLIRIVGSDIPGEQTTAETEEQRFERWRKEARRQVDAHSPDATDHEKQMKINEVLRQLMFEASG